MTAPAHQASLVSLYYNVVSQVVEFYPHLETVVEKGFPAAATFAAFGGMQSNDDTPKFTGSATADGTSTTISSATGKGQANKKKINLTSTSGVVLDRHYLLEAALGHREIATPRELGSAGGAHAFATDDLRFDYASADTFRGLRQTAAIPDAFVQTLGNINTSVWAPFLKSAGLVQSNRFPTYRMRWTYTIAGATQIEWTYFNLVRQPFRHRVTVEHLLSYFPDLVDQEPKRQRGKRLQAQIDLAHRDLGIEVGNRGYDPDQIREGPIADKLVELWSLWRCAAFAAPPGWSVVEWRRECEREVATEKEKAFGASLHMWLDLATAGSITPDPPQQLFFKR